MNISEFPKGADIVRTEPALGYGDRSYIGEKLTLVGCANGCIYFDRQPSSLFPETRMDLAQDIWSEGWEQWVDIENDNRFRTMKSDELTKFNILKELELAIKNENYELLAEVTLMLKKL
jgi:hypothetical protein